VSAAAETREAALELACHGWPVFPLSATSKEPRKGSRGFYDATCDTTKVEAWEWEGANIGIRTGRPAQLVVVDVDPGHDGDHALYELEREHGPLPQSVESKTGNGGRHVYLRCEEAIRSRTNAPARGIDVRADGGYVVAPPSLHPNGRRYEWALEPAAVDLEPAPVWLIQALRKSKERPRKSVVRGGPIVMGERNTTLTRIAGSLVRSGLSSQNAVLAALLAENVRRCKPPLPTEEIERIASSATRWSQPWVTDPNAYITDVRLSRGARQILQALAGHANHEGRCYPGYRRLSEITGITKNYIGRFLDELAEHDRIRIQHHAKGRKSYELLPFNIPNS
jgi:hypothetical protein